MNNIERANKMSKSVIITIMKIVHVCISAPYIDGWGYQENLLPKYMAMRGNDVHVIAPYRSFPGYVSEDVADEINAKGKEYIFDNVMIHRVDVVSISDSLIIPYGLCKIIKKLKPDVVFHHNVNPFSLLVAAISKGSKCLLYVDNHADDINCSKNEVWSFLYYKCFIRISCDFLSKYVNVYYGVTYSRCEFLHDYFGIDYNNISLLPIGADTELASTIDSKDLLRCKYGFTPTDRIIVSGGKMGIDKGTDLLIDAVAKLNDTGVSAKLVLFGKYGDDATYDKAIQCPFVYNFGWCDRRKTLELLKIGDVACWPIHHTTLCEDAISVGTPLILRKTGTTSHLIEGNGSWIINDDLLYTINLFFRCNMQEVSLKCDDIKHKLSYWNIVEEVLTRHEIEKR